MSENTEGRIYEFEEIFPSTHKAERDVVRYEDTRTLPLNKFLATCNVEEAALIAAITDPQKFVDNARAFIRRVEAACYRHRSRRLRGRSQVLSAYAAAMSLTPAIRRMRLVLLNNTEMCGSPRSQCRFVRIGVACLIRDLNWALRVLEQAIPAWGY